jgi:hypothetical protein
MICNVSFIQKIFNKNKLIGIHAPYPDSVIYELITYILLACVPAHSSVLTSRCCNKKIGILYSSI